LLFAAAAPPQVALVNLTSFAPLPRRALALALAFVLAAPPALAPAQVTGSDLPALGEAAADDLSPANERKLGEAIMRQARFDPTYLADPDTADYLNNLGFQLVSVSPSRHIDFEFFAVRDATMNAFALPGGFIGVHSGLVLTAQSEGELASVLAHEIGHVAQRHIARMLAKQRDSTAIAIGALLLALLAARSNSSSSADLTQAAVIGGQAAAVQQQLNFSREAEREADRVGLQILTDAGFDPRAAATFFGRMQQGSRVYESAAPAYLRTHPMTTERIGDLQARVRELNVSIKARMRPDSLDFHLVRARLRVLQDDTLQGGRDAAAHFTSQIRERTAASEAAAHYGLAVASLRLNQPRAALDSALQARRLAGSPAPMIEKAVAEARFATAEQMTAGAARDTELTAAIKLAQDSSARFPLSPLTALTYVNLLQRSGQHDRAVTYMREQLAIPRSRSQHYELLARSYAALNKMTLSHQATAEAYYLLGALPLAVQQLQLARKAADADFYAMSEVDARMRQLMRELKEQREEAIRAGRPAPDEPPDEGAKKRR
jgi:predicted Zn-dependent protease